MSVLNAIRANQVRFIKVFRITIRWISINGVSNLFSILKKILGDVPVCIDRVESLFTSLKHVNAVSDSAISLLDQ